jgi:hypothetical protein
VRQEQRRLVALDLSASHETNDNEPGTIKLRSRQEPLASRIADGSRKKGSPVLDWCITESLVELHGLESRCSRFVLGAFLAQEEVHVGLHITAQRVDRTIHQARNSKAGDHDGAIVSNRARRNATNLERRLTP